MRAEVFRTGVVLWRSEKYAKVPRFRRKSRRVPRRGAGNRFYQSELKRLQRLTKDVIPDDKRTAIMPLMSNIAFLKVKLDQARVELMGESIFTEYDNGGGQSGLREHPGFSAYNKLFTTFARGIKQITDMMPSGSTAADALVDYLNETRFGG